jgi:hypothetical protein
MNSTQWNQMVDFFASSLGLSAGQRDRLEKNPVARLVAELPFLAGAEQAERTAYAHLSVLLTAARNPRVFGHDATDTLEGRLFALSSFKGGDPRIIDRGMKLLALCSLGDHIRDAEFDAAQGKYNPVNAGDLDAKLEAQRLTLEIQAVASPEMDSIVSPNDAILVWWINLAEAEVNDVSEQSA